jgi:hypothetical protein
LTRWHNNLPIPGLSFFFERYDSQALEKALKKAFGSEHYLFGTNTLQRHFDTKVALTSCSKSGGAYIFGNYNRASDGECSFIIAIYLLILGSVFHL